MLTSTRGLCSTEDGSPSQLFLWATGGGGLEHSKVPAQPVCWLSKCASSARAAQPWHKAENRVAHCHTRNVGRTIVFDINIAAISALLDNAVVDGAICRHQSSCQKGKAQGVQCRIPVS